MGGPLLPGLGAPPEFLPGLGAPPEFPAPAAPQQPATDPWNTPAQVPSVEIGEVTVVPTQRSVDVSSRGMTDAGLRRAGQLGSSADRKADASMKPFQAERDRLAGALDAGYDDVREATRRQAEATRAFHEEEVAIHRQEMEFYQHSGAMEKQLAAEGEAEREKYLGSYREQLAGIKQLAMMSGNPMSQMSKGEEIGLVGAQFAQGFLAAQGINIDVAGQVDRWVERGIKEHQLRIANARDAAGDQLHLYEIARQSSQDEYEARQRYRGFVVESLKSSIMMGASKFNSDIALSRAKEQTARLDLEQTRTEQQIGDSYFQKWHSVKVMEKDAAYKQGMLANESRRIKLAEKAQAWEQSAENPKNKSSDPYFHVFDTETKDVKVTDPISGKEITVKAPKNAWLIDKSNETALKGAVEARNQWGQYDADWNQTMRLRDEAMKDLNSKGWLGSVSKGNTFGLAARQSPAYQAYISAWNKMIATQIQAETGAAATDTQFKQMYERYPHERMIQAGDGTKAWAEMRESARNRWEIRMETYEGRGRFIKASPGAATDYGNTNNNGERIKTFVDKEAGEAAEGAKGGLITHIDNIAKAYLTPEQVIAQEKLKEDPAVMKQEALEVLQRMAKDEKIVPARRKYAADVLRRLQEDPTALTKEYETTGGPGLSGMDEIRAAWNRHNQE